MTIFICHYSFGAFSMHSTISGHLMGGRVLTKKIISPYGGSGKRQAIMLIERFSLGSTKTINYRP
jgi:hypothetical protein